MCFFRQLLQHSLYRVFKPRPSFCWRGDCYSESVFQLFLFLLSLFHVYKSTQLRFILRLQTQTHTNFFCSLLYRIVMIELMFACSFHKIQQNQREKHLQINIATFWFLFNLSVWISNFSILDIRECIFNNYIIVVKKGIGRGWVWCEDEVNIQLPVRQPSPLVETVVPFIWFTFSIVIIALHYHCYDLFVCLFSCVKAFAIL